VLDGEAVWLAVDGVADFAGLHSRKHNDEVQHYVFDLLSIDGDDLRLLPLHLRKNQLARLMARRVAGVQLAPFEQGEIGPDLFRAACGMASRASSPSAATGPIAPADLRTGLRSRTHRRQQC
jgi:bifunctional non-homologous end joining protein LigD